MTIEGMAERNFDEREEGAFPLYNGDLNLAQIELDPEIARFHTTLHKVPKPVIEEQVDSVYIAAAAGNPYAEGIIYGAAMNQANQLPRNTAFDGESPDIPEQQWDEYQRALDEKDAASQPIADEAEALTIVDQNIEEIDLILFRNRQYLSPAVLDKLIS